MSASGGDHSWLRGGATETGEIRRRYDAWADSYDSTLEDWDYRAPADAAAMLRQVVPAGAAILDAGCGTGLTGGALRDAGFTGPIDGVDLSPTSLERARGRGVYRTLLEADLQTPPLPLGDDSYDAVQCVGVLTYVPDAAPLFRDFVRLARRGGHVLFTQRDDLFAERDYRGLIGRLAAAGLWAEVEISAPRPYLPGNAEFGSEIQVIHALLRVTA